jgi:hypothetical protein
MPNDFAPTSPPLRPGRPRPTSPHFAPLYKRGEVGRGEHKATSTAPTSPRHEQLDLNPFRECDCFAGLFGDDVEHIAGCASLKGVDEREEA